MLLGAEPRKRRRLSRSGDFDRVYRDGRSAGNRFLVLYAFPRAPEDGGEVRLGITVGKRVGKAVVRNRVKRAIRESFWALSEQLPPGHDFVVVARPGVEAMLEQKGSAELADSLASLLGEIDPSEER